VFLLVGFERKVGKFCAEERKKNAKIRWICERLPEKTILEKLLFLNLLRILQ